MLNSARRQDAKGSFLRIAGLHLTAFEPFAKDAGWSLAEAVLIAGNFFNAVATGRDIYMTIGDYRECMNGYCKVTGGSDRSIQ